ncbi:hypothetical protein EON81_20580 [bacterium]|nr:MAG: hypothetical protein EON81_20580 [bacterium]
MSVIAAENANLTNISSNTLIGMTDTRSITVMLMGGASLAPEGTELPVENNGDSDSFATVVYTEAGATINPPRGWVGISGKATVVSRSGSQVRVKLDNVRMTKETDNDTAATGAFTLNGAMTGTKSNP